MNIFNESILENEIEDVLDDNNVLTATNTKTVSNKDLTSATNTFPTTLVTTNTTQSITGQKTFTSPICDELIISGTGDRTARLVGSFNTTNKTITFSDATQTVCTTNTAQTISAIKTFSSAPVISSITNTGTLTLPTSSDTLVGRATSDNLTNKNLNDASCFIIDNADNTKRIAFDCSSNSANITCTLFTQATAARTLSFPDITDTIVTLTASQALTGKTITSSNDLITYNTASNVDSANLTTTSGTQWDASVLTLYWSKIGNIVCVQWGDSGTVVNPTTGNPQKSGVLPVGFRPITEVYAVYRCTTGGAAATAIMRVTTAGSVVWHGLLTAATNSWTISGNAAIIRGSISYLVQ